MSLAGRGWPAALTLLFAAGFAMLGLYALSGAGRVRPLPLLRTGLVAAATVYLLRGLLLVPGLVALAAGRPGHPPRALLFSAVALAIGICPAAGLVTGWSGRSPGRGRAGWALADTKEG